MNATPYLNLDPGNRAAQAQKAALRTQLLGRRRGIPADLRNTTQWKAVNHLRTLLGELTPSVVALYMPQGGEIDVRPLISELWQQGQTVALPRVVYRGHPLTFNIYAPHDPLEPDALGLPCATGPEIWPATVVVPMVGYHRKGYRLGYGGGYYDMTLKRPPVPTRTVGLCHTELEIGDFPAEYADVRLDYVVTGKEVIVCV